MPARLTTLAAALIACTAPAWAATSNVDIYGQLTLSVDTVSPAYGTYSAAADIGSNFFSGTPFVSTVDITEAAGQTAGIALADYNAQAKTSLGNNHAFTQASGFGNGAFAVGSFSGWYDQVAITGGTGTGTAQFSIRLTGTVTAGALLGEAAYGLLASSVHPTQLVDSLDIVDTAASPTLPWALDSDQVTEIALYDIVASPYNDPDRINALFIPTTTPGDGISGIPAFDDPALPSGDGDLADYLPDLILTPGANQAIDVTLTGTLEFTYGEAFYLIGALGTTVFSDELLPFDGFGISDTPEAPVPDGSGATTLDFFNSAHLVDIVVPQGASLSSASGAAYNVTAVPEPGEWLLMLAGMGLVGWRVQRRA